MGEAYDEEWSEEPLAAAATLQQHFFPPSSPYHSMSPTAQAAIIKVLVAYQY